MILQATETSEISPERYGSWKIGNALQFDGADDSVDAGNNALLDSTSAMTVEAWVYQDCAGYNCPFGSVASKNGFV